MARNGELMRGPSYRVTFSPPAKPSYPFAGEPVAFQAVEI
jgi:hypothetical protein